MNSIDREYFAKIRAMSPQQRIERCVSLFDAIHLMIQNKILQENPDLNAKELRRQIAMHLYRSDSPTQTLLQAME